MISWCETFQPQAQIASAVECGKRVYIHLNNIQGEIWRKRNFSIKIKRFL